MTHELKCWPVYWQAVFDHQKMFEIRKADRQYAVGDVLVLNEFEPDAISGYYTGASVRVGVTAIWRGVPGVEKGYVVMAIQRCNG